MKEREKRALWLEGRGVFRGSKRAINQIYYQKSECIVERNIHVHTHTDK